MEFWILDMLYWPKRWPTSSGWERKWTGQNSSAVCWKVIYEMWAMLFIDFCFDLWVNKTWSCRAWMSIGWLVLTRSPFQRPVLHSVMLFDVRSIDWLIPWLFFVFWDSLKYQCVLKLIVFHLTCSCIAHPLADVTFKWSHITMTTIVLQNEGGHGPAAGMVEKEKRNLPLHRLFY